MLFKLKKLFQVSIFQARKILQPKKCKGLFFKKFLWILFFFKIHGVPFNQRVFKIKVVKGNNFKVAFNVLKFKIKMEICKFKINKKMSFKNNFKTQKFKLKIAILMIKLYKLEIKNKKIKNI